MTDTLGSVLDEVRERVEPSAEERAALREAIDALLDRTREALAAVPADGEPILVGSTARGTWMRGDRDIDVFVRFPTDLSDEELERHGLEVGHAVLPEGREEYAEHPYVTGEFEGFDVDLVPCYAVESARDIRSSVDRTPFHTAYVEERLADDLAAEVRVLKAFLRGIGIYGSDLRTRGVSGYLAELLVLEYGGVAEVVEAAADWRPPVELDPEGHGVETFDDPLVVIDPTDPARNVAAVVSETNVARLIHHARDLLADPRVGVFFPDDPEPLDEGAVRDHLEARGTTPVALVFETPDLVEDELYPQLRKSLAGIDAALSRRGFETVRRALAAGDRTLLLFELSVPERPRIERHEGPPVHVREHAEGFYRTYEETDAYGPFVEDGRYVVEREREFESAREFLGSEALFDARLGPAIEDALREGHEVVAGEDVAALAGEFGDAFASYFDPRP